MTLDNDREIPYELSSVCRFSQPKQRRNGYHLLRDARILPCGHIACLDCIVNAIKRNGNFIDCNFKKTDHIKECTARHEMTLIEADRLQKNNEYETVIQENYREIGKFINDNLLTYISNAKNHSLNDFAEIIKYHYEEALIRGESLKIIYDEVVKKVESNTQSFIDTRNISSLQNIRQMIQNTVFDIQPNQYGHIRKVCHEKIKNNEPVILQFRSHMKTTKGIVELNDSKFAIYGENRDESNIACSDENLVIKIFDKNYKFINEEITKINYERPHEGVQELELQNLVKLCSDKNGNIYILLRNRIFLCDNSLRNCKKIIFLPGGCNGVDIAYYESKIYVLNRHGFSVEIFSTEGLANQKLNLEDEDGDELNNANSISVANNILIVYCDQKKIYLYSYDYTNETIHFRTSITTQRETIMCIFENCLFTLDTNSRLTCFELKIQEGNIEYNELYYRKVDYLGRRMKSILFTDENLMILSEDEDIIVLI